MKRLSIKLRVTLWFTAFMLVVVSGVLAFLLVTGKRMAASNSLSTLRRVVSDSLEEIEYDDGALEIDDDLEYFTDGVYVAVYDEAGGLLYGRLPTGFTAAPPLSDGNVQTVRGDAGAYSVYDTLHALGKHGHVWVRGVMPESDRTVNAMLRLAMIALPFLVLIASVGGYLLIDRAFLPVRRITATAERIGGGTDLAARIALGEGRDEIYTLAATFDRMLDRLQASFESEKRFTSDASHELRTPTAVIISQCEYALENASTPDESRRALASVLEQAQRMSALIAQLLTLARADGGHAKLSPEPLDLSELAEMVAAQITEIAAEKNIAVQTEIEPGLLLYGDETMLLRMLLNLMENGVKYGVQGGRLVLRLYREGETIRGEVRDNGIGISQTDLVRVWERFYQADPARSAKGGGAGLGLPMVKYIAEAHGGSVSAQSAPGEGSVFSFSLPVSCAK